MSAGRDVATLEALSFSNGLSATSVEEFTTLPGRRGSLMSRFVGGIQAGYRLGSGFDTDTVEARVNVEGLSPRGAVALEI
jgi:hypothetical protein